MRIFLEWYSVYTNMTLFISTIDTVYEAVIRFTVLCVRAYISPAPPQEFDGADDALIQESTHTLPREEKQTFKTVQDILKKQEYALTPEVKNMVMYTGSVDVPVYKNPTIEFDAKATTIPYGEMVMMLEPRGRFYRIVWGTTEGWVLKDDVVDRAVRVYPEFRIGEENSVDHSNTAHVRAILNDVFSIGRSEFPLQAGEYVLYRLWKKGIHIDWPITRPRVPGLWHKILKGTPNIHVGVIPKVGAIMEYMWNNDVGHLAYVEAVFPDNTITISEVNFPDSGIYNERELTKEEWKELKPVFITVS